MRYLQQYFPAAPREWADNTVLKLFLRLHAASSVKRRIPSEFAAIIRRHQFLYAVANDPAVVESTAEQLSVNWAKLRDIDSDDSRCARTYSRPIVVTHVSFGLATSNLLAPRISASGLKHLGSRARWVGRIAFAGRIVAWWYSRGALLGKSIRHYTALVCDTIIASRNTSCHHVHLEPHLSVFTQWLGVPVEGQG